MSRDGNILGKTLRRGPNTGQIHEQTDRCDVVGCKPAIVKTGDFVKDTQAGYYRQERELAYAEKVATGKYGPTTWDDDLRTWLIAEGVPEQYLSKVAYRAYEQGHAHGEESMLEAAQGLVEIFQ